MAGTALRLSAQPATPLRYGENPHQAGTFYGDLSALFDQLHGKQLSYNNLVDVDAAVALMAEFADGQPACAILKHTNACGVAQADTLRDAYVNALSCDPTFGFRRRHHREQGSRRSHRGRTEPSCSSKC